jgi:hypothetical protein
MEYPFTPQLAEGMAAALTIVEPARKRATEREYMLGKDDIESTLE